MKKAVMEIVCSKDGMRLASVLKKAGLVGSLSVARRAVAQGAVTIDEKKIGAASTTFLPGEKATLRVGKSQPKVVYFFEEMPADNISISAFIEWRSEVDSDGILDDYDLALAWFAAKGYSNSEASEIARIYKQKMDLLRLPGY